MSSINTADIELTHYSGVVIPLTVETIRDRNGVAQARSIRSALSAAVADSPMADWLEPYVQETWIGGCGGGGAKRGYTQAPGLVTRIGDSEQGYVFPGPAAIDTSYPAANNSDTAIRGIEEYEDDLYYVQGGTSVANTPRVMIGQLGGALLSDSLGGASGYPIAANNFLTGLITFRHGAAVSTNRLYASGNDTAGGRLHALDSTTVWTSTASSLFGGTRFDWLQKVFWRTANGDQGHRMVAGDANNNMISYTRPDADPMLAASWVLNAFRVETVGKIRRPPTIRRRLLVPSIDNVYDVDELGNTPGIMSDMDRLRHPFNGWASWYQDDYVYFSLGEGLGRVFVGEAGLLQTTPGQCGPGAFTGAEHEFGGWVTAITGDQGYVVVATYNPNNNKTGIWWGRDRKYYPEIETANPMIWWGPEIFSEEGLFVTAMRTYTRLSENTMHLWVAAIPYTPSAIDYGGGEPTLHYFSLPTAGQPLSDYLTGGNNLFATGTSPGPWQTRCEMTSLPYTWGDKAAKKFINDTTVGSRGLDLAGDTTNMELYTRADPEPGDTSFGSGKQIGVSPVQTEVPAVVTSGNKTQYRIKLISPNGASSVYETRSVGVLDSVRMTAFRRVASVRILDVTVQYGHGIRKLDGGVDDSKSVADIRELLTDLTEGDRTTMRIRPDRRYTVLARQVMDETDELIDNQERATVRMQIGILGSL